MTGKIKELKDILLHLYQWSVK